MDQALVPGGPTALTPDPFSYPRYTIKRRFWSLFDRRFRVFGPDGRLLMSVKRPVFKLRQEFNVWADEAETQPLLQIKSRQIVAINFAYDITDARTGEWLGAVQKRGLKSIFRDTFELMDQQGTVIGKAAEIGSALLRRIFPILTSKHDIWIGEQVVTQIRQKFRFFNKEFNVDLSMGVGKIDPRFSLAVALLALMAEARREERN
ncbi:MAG: hypothetical protein H6709_03900 [Kofleriaceae bacterium]|nr:hypothetical protein [Myxococcales bacterium]MCB9560222.1 hypothetical protein [Kofleriaceae bacterium]MCB9571213.1 hypothetical protein [Kofleriaceae bacterium]